MSSRPPTGGFRPESWEKPHCLVFERKRQLRSLAKSFKYERKRLLLHSDVFSFRPEVPVAALPAALHSGLVPRFAFLADNYFRNMSICYWKFSQVIPPSEETIVGKSKFKTLTHHPYLPNTICFSLFVSLSSGKTLLQSALASIVLLPSTDGRRNDCVNSKVPPGFMEAS